MHQILDFLAVLDLRLSWRIVGLVITAVLLIDFALDCRQNRAERATDAADRS